MVLAVRARLVTYLQEWWPELDVRPNSVFGDLYLTPMATLLAAAEIAYSRRDSDLNLVNVAQGIIFDPEFVDAFLGNFGASLRGAVRASGLVKLSLSEDQTYVFDADTAFTFNGQTFKVRPEEGNPVVLRSSTDLSPGRRLIRSEGQFYTALLPVVGSAGSVVSDQSAGDTSWTEPNLVGVTAIGDFDPGNQGDSLADRALRARYLFAAATLTSRAGAESFVRSLFPNVNAVSVVVTSDAEMVRDGANVLAVSEGALDVYVRSRKTYARDQTQVRLAYDPNRDAWVGALTTASVPAFFSSSIGVFRADRPNNERSTVRVYSRSTHPDIDWLGVAYSAFEQLGLEVADLSPSGFTEARNGEPVRMAGVGSLLISGQYGGYRFGVRPGRRVSLRYDDAVTSEGVTYAAFIVRDLDTQETGTVWFAPNTNTAPTYGLLAPDLQDARRFFNGLALRLDEAGSFAADGFGGTVFELDFTARAADFLVDYQLDPMLPVIDQTIGSGDNKPVGVSVMTKSFIICQVTRMNLTYRTFPGSTFNADQARKDIADYLNGLVHPEPYDPAALSVIVTRNGAAGLVSSQVQGRFYPTLAHVFVDKLGHEYVIEHPLTTNLLPPPNTLNYGPRNIAYLVDLNTIQFTSDAG